MNTHVFILAGLLLCSPAAATAAGRVLKLTGTLTADGKALKAGDALPNSEVLLGTGTAILAIEGGRFLLTGPARLTPRKSNFRLDLGSLLSAVKHAAGKNFSVRTPSAVAAVRGTDFYIEVGPKKEVDVCICNGALKVTAEGMEPLDMAAEYHLNYRFWSVQGGKKATAGELPGKTTAREVSPRRGHTDGQLAVLRELLDEEKP